MTTNWKYFFIIATISLSYSVIDFYFVESETVLSIIAPALIMSLLYPSRLPLSLILLWGVQFWVNVFLHYLSNDAPRNFFKVAENILFYIFFCVPVGVITGICGYILRLCLNFIVDKFRGVER